MEEVNELQANYKTGWIRIYRSIKKHWLFPKKRPLTELEAWITILIEVNHENEKFRIGYEFFECNRGEKYYSLETWANLFKWNKSKVRRFFNLLQKDSMIELKSVQKTTHLIVCNYESYQGERNDNETIVKQKRNDSETKVTPIKEYKNDNNDKEVYLSKIQAEFYDTLKQFINSYSKEILRDFYNYWSEPNKSRTKIRWQLEKTWDVKKRLDRWVSNDFNKSKKIEQEQPQTYIPNFKK